VLIVDDDPPTLDMFARVLRRRGFSVETALTAHQALDEINRRRPDVLLVDLRLPSMDGLALLKVLFRAAGPRIPAAIITGDRAIDDAAVTQIGALGVRIVFKPLGVEDLVILVNSLLEAASG
jgi:DNA-binding NtrC family response regulator